MNGKTFLASLAGELWSCRPENLAAFVELLEHIEGEPNAADGNRIGEDANQSKNYRLVDGVAHIPINGLILKNVPSYFKYYGIRATGTDDIIRAVGEAVDDRDVRSILFMVDSPGGTISGVQDAADAIYSARSSKPVYSHFETLAASAAYWLGAQAGRITASKSTLTGSIGVYRVMDDYSRLFLSRGITTHVLRSHELKGAGVIGAPITENQLKAEQQIIDRAFGYFVDAVARGRGRDASALAPSATGQVWFSEDAQTRGLIDGIASAAEAHAFAAGAEPPRSLNQFIETVADASPPRANATQPAPDGARKEDMSTDNKAVDSAAELAAAKREAEEAKREAAIARKEAEIEKAALAEVKKQRCTAAIDVAAKAGRIAPSMRTMIDEYASLVGFDVARVEKHLADLPVVTRTEPKGDLPKDDRDVFADDGFDANAPHAVRTGRWVSTKEEDELVAKKLGVSIDDMNKYAKVKGVDPVSRKLHMRDGSVKQLEKRGE